jgi:hypothetical protein
VKRSGLRVIEGGRERAGLERPGEGGLERPGEGGLERPEESGRERLGGGGRARPLEAALPAAATTGRLDADRGRGLVAGVLATAGAWLVEPAEPAPEAPVHAPPRPRAVVAVFGLAAGCGATVVARALAAELAARDASGTAAVACEGRPAGIPLATQAASRLARALEDLPGAATRAVGRLCLIEGADQLTLAETSRQVAPLVLDAGSGSLGGMPASLADRAVLVAAPRVEPALARVAGECLARVGAESIVVLNRVRPDRDIPSAASEFMSLPDSRLGAQLALGGREARGDLGRAIAMLADRCEGIA